MHTRPPPARPSHVFTRCGARVGTEGMHHASKLTTCRATRPSSAAACLARLAGSLNPPARAGAQQNEDQRGTKLSAATALIRCRPLRCSRPSSHCRTKNIRNASGSLQDDAPMQMRGPVSSPVCIRATCPSTIQMTEVPDQQFSHVQGLDTAMWSWQKHEVGDCNIQQLRLTRQRLSGNCCR